MNTPKYCINCHHCAHPRTPQDSDFYYGCLHSEIATVNLVTGKIEALRCSVARGLEKTEHPNLGKCSPDGILFEAKKS